jgi:NADH-quinone oxidoreductase subunit C
MTSLITILEEKFPEAVVRSHAWRGDETVTLDGSRILEVARFIKESPELACNFLMDLTAVDYSAFGDTGGPAFFASSGYAASPTSQIPDEDPWPGPPDSARFAVVYHFYSTVHRHRLRLVVPLQSADPEVDSLTTLWPGANWLEREAWDMFGVVFTGHPDLRRILMYQEFEGYPLRKDYTVNERQPLIGPVN